jgi:alpha-tubulin suppressor-like RCC1 family protein
MSALSKLARAAGLYNVGAFWRPKTTTTLTAYPAFLWGQGNTGALGLGTTASHSSPVQMAGSWVSIVAGSANDTADLTFTMAIKTNGTLWAWGDNGNGELGVGNRTDYSSPVQVPGSWTQVYPAVVGSNNFTVAIRNDGTLWGWGDNTYGMMCASATTFAAFSSPVQLASGSWVSASASNGYWMAIRNDSTLWGAGSNTTGGLTKAYAATKISSPVQIAGSWSQISCGNSNIDFGGPILGIKTNGSLWAWGINDDGSLGIGTTADSSSPTQIGTATNWKQVSAGFADTTFALNQLGQIWGSGSNGNGTLGIGTTTNHSSPVQVPGSWTQVTAGSNFTFGLRPDSSLWVWGNDITSSGALGNGTATGAKSSPIQIPGSWLQISASAGHVVAQPV